MNFCLCWRIDFCAGDLLWSWEYQAGAALHCIWQFDIPIRWILIAFEDQINKLRRWKHCTALSCASSLECNMEKLGPQPLVENRNTQAIPSIPFGCHLLPLLSFPFLSFSPFLIIMPFCF